MQKQKIEPIEPIKYDIDYCLERWITYISNISCEAICKKDIKGGVIHFEEKTGLTENERIKISMACLFIRDLLQIKKEMKNGKIKSNIRNQS